MKNLSVLLFAFIIFMTGCQSPNDPCAGIHRIHYVSPDHIGLGGW